ncbi:hypothetical protein PsorP6_001753 [Peronosclerospora sorghi]|uniref:Uncharacterized protein n=1 Tax=Peronosclerospora sorghi TaxID=230839 RepID=A0ACC0WS47_9STRA|nr:hypothetical protein PsorP6_001753 [Peronosclerospora sorghi]
MIPTLYWAQSALIQALERHNVFGLVTDGKALTKWQSRLLALMEGSSAAQRVGWELMLTTMRQSPFERLEALAVKLLERVVKVLKQQQSRKEENEDTEKATFSACGVAQVLLLHVEKYSPDTRREMLELLGKLLQPLVALLSTCKSNLVVTLMDLIATLLRSSPNSLRSYATKIESACVATLFSCADVDKLKAHRATVCLALLCNVFDQPQQMWLQMAQKALAAAHQQLDLFASKRFTLPSAEEVMGKKLWVQGAASRQLPLYQRADVTLNRMNWALNALCELVSARTLTQCRGQISEREVQQILPDIILFARRALGIRADEVGKHTGVSDDGERLPICVIYAVLPRVYALALRTLSSFVERAGICALRHASTITRALLLASESVGDGEDLQALANATAVCARRMGASTVEKLGIPLLNELMMRSKRSLGETKATTDAAMTLAAQQNDAKDRGKSKKRKRQAAAAATLAALNESRRVADQARFVSMRDERVGALSLTTILTAVASCVSVYGSLLPEDCRSLVNEFTLKALQCRQNVRSSHANDAIDPVTLALLSGTVTADHTGSHGMNLLCGIQYWQRRVAGSGGASSALELVALNAGEAILHPRAPPMTINVHEGPKNEGKASGGFSRTNSHGVRLVTLAGDAMDWDENESEDAETEQKIVQQKQESVKPDAGTVLDDGEEEDEDEEEDYDDSHVPNASTAIVTDLEMDEAEANNKGHDKVDDVPAVQHASNSEDKKLPTAAVVEEEEEDDFPDIVIDDD